ncbi:MAG: Trk system potassium transporter TrkA [Clostridiaceae bacterium]|nr:Trk system potassium transporter TrkA [Clostridiaceae bacterium]
MNIVIVGAGKVGETLCVDLVAEQHDIVLIDLDEERLEHMIAIADITGVVGNGALYDIQQEAGVASCDVFIAVTPSDETNIIAAITAHTLGARHVIARVRSPEYSLQMNFLRERLGIRLMINPDLEAARDIERMILLPSAQQVEHFEQGRVNLAAFLLPGDTELNGVALRDLTLKNGRVIVCIIERDGEVIIPDGNARLLHSDIVYVTGKPRDLEQFQRRAGLLQKPIRSALIIGGGRITRYLLPRLQRLRIQIKVIEVNPEIADALAADFPDVEVICGDGTDQMFLHEERVAGFDAVIALTGIDEENILVSLYASDLGVRRTITKVNRIHLMRLMCKVAPQTTHALQSVVTPHHLIADRTIRYIRSIRERRGSNIDAFYRLADARVEALQFHVVEASRATGIPLMELPLRSNLLLALIQREGQLIYPGGNDVILPGDHVLVITTQRNISTLDDILRDAGGAS